MAPADNEELSATFTFELFFPSGLAKKKKKREYRRTSCALERSWLLRVPEVLLVFVFFLTDLVKPGKGDPSAGIHKEK